jgi:transcriptional regulator GlxA family with amidase domain
VSKSSPSQRERTRRVPPAGQPPRPLSVGIVLLDRFTLCELGLFTDILRWAADEGDRSRQVKVRWSVMSPRTEPLRASCGLSVSPSSPMLPAAELDYVVLIGGQLSRAQHVDAELANYLRASARAGVTLVGLSPAGTFVLYRSGVMQGRRCCMSWFHYQDFLDEFPGQEAVADQLYLVDGDRITCAGGSGSADVAIHLVARHLGEGVAQKASHFLLLERARVGSEAQPHAPIAGAVTDSRIRRALLLMEQNLARPLPIGALARKIKVSQRHLERLFFDELGCSPADLYRSIRMRHAAWLLGRTDRPITDIALNSGFADCAHFSREFRRAFGTAPSKWRTSSPVRHGELAASRIFE